MFQIDWNNFWSPHFGDIYSGQQHNSSVTDIILVELTYQHILAVELYNFRDTIFHGRMQSPLPYKFRNNQANALNQLGIERSHRQLFQEH